MICLACAKTRKVLTPHQALLIQSTTTYRHKLVLDIDETLIYTTTALIYNPSAIITYQSDDQLKTYYITVRPHAREFIVYMNQLYDVYFYSASCIEVSFYSVR